MEITNKTINSEREKIDLIDENLVKLLDKRFEIVRNISKIKIVLGKPIFQQGREEIVLNKVKKISSNADTMEKIFKEILNQAKKLQEELQWK